MSTEDSQAVFKAIADLAHGNIGSINAMTKCMAVMDQIHPSAELGIVTVPAILADFGIESSNIWLLFKDVADEDPITMVAILYAVQDEFIPLKTVLNALQHRYGTGNLLTEVQKASILANVREKRPDFIGPEQTLREPSDLEQDGSPAAKEAV